VEAANFQGFRRMGVKVSANFTRRIRGGSRSACSRQKQEKFSRESSVREADLVCGTINEAQGSGQQGPSLLWRRGSKKGVAKRIPSEKKSKTELQKNSTPKRVSPANKRLSALAQAFAPPQFELTVDLLPFSGSVRPVPPTQTLSQNILNLVDYPQKLLDFCTCLLIF
jgi:hypothetical protein